MAKRKSGPRPTPTKTLANRGSNLVYSKQRQGEVKINPEKPRCPDWLGDVLARKIWRKTVADLYNAGLVCKLDTNILALYCEAMAGYIQIREQITGNFIKTTNGNIITHPGVPLRNKLFEQITKLSAELGLSPSARVGLEPVKRGSGKSGTGRFFKNKNNKAAAS